MSGDKRKALCTVDHAAKQRDALGFDAYEYWLKQVRRLKAAKQRRRDDRFRRDTADGDPA